MSSIIRKIPIHGSLFTYLRFLQIYDDNLSEYPMRQKDP